MTAVSAEVRATAAVGAMAVLLAVALGVADEGIFVAPARRAGHGRDRRQLRRRRGGRPRSRFEAASARADAALAGERAARSQAELLARASELLATPLDPEERLGQVAALAVPELADLGMVDLLRRRLAARRGRPTPPTPRRRGGAATPARRCPIDPDGSHPVAVAARRRAAARSGD